MRLIKVLGLAAFSALAAMAVLGAGTASAVTHDQLGLCKKLELVLCTDLIPVGSGHFVGNATNPVLEGTLAEKCASSFAKGLVTSALDATLMTVKIDELTFTSCSPCSTVTVNNLPLSGTGQMGTLLGSDFTLTSKGNATLSNCTFGLTCKFGSESVTSLVEMAEGGESVLNTNKAVLNFEGGSEFFCGKTGKWNAKYGLKWELLPSGELDPVTFTLLGA
jgi:hypothetical protein